MTRGLSKQRAFLEAFKRTASVTRAAEAAKVERGMHYRWLAADAAYVEAFAGAKEEAAQGLEDEAIRRAHEGVDEPVVYHGGFSYEPAVDPVTRQILRNEAGHIEYSDRPLVVRTYSDTLLMFLLKGARPEKFRERGAVELSGPGGGPIPLDQQRLEGLSNDELAQLTALAQKLAQSPDAGSGGPAKGPQ